LCGKGHRGGGGAGPERRCGGVGSVGLAGARFCFEGFLTVSRSKRRERLEALKEEQRTMIFLEAPHKLQRTLADMAEVFGQDRRLALARELTKIHEEVLRTTLKGAMAHFSETKPRGRLFWWFRARCHLKKASHCFAAEIMR
jgi:16S rRNA (cytidine1402-2'-O)-methyltransferase